MVGGGAQFDAEGAAAVRDASDPNPKVPGPRSGGGTLFHHLLFHLPVFGRPLLRDLKGNQYFKDNFDL